MVKICKKGILEEVRVRMRRKEGAGGGYMPEMWGRGGDGVNLMGGGDAGQKSAGWASADDEKCPLAEDGEKIGRNKWKKKERPNPRFSVPLLCDLAFSASFLNLNFIFYSIMIYGPFFLFLFPSLLASSHSFALFDDKQKFREKVMETLEAAGMEEMLKYPSKLDGTKSGGVPEIDVGKLCGAHKGRHIWEKFEMEKDKLYHGLLREFGIRDDFFYKAGQSKVCEILRAIANAEEYRGGDGGQNALDIHKKTAMKNENEKMERKKELSESSPLIKVTIGGKAPWGANPNSNNFGGQKFIKKENSVAVNSQIVANPSENAINAAANTIAISSEQNAKNDKFVVKFGIVQASKFFNKMEDVKGELLQRRNHQDICNKFLYKNDLIFGKFNELVDQLADTKNALINKAGEMFKKPAFDNGERRMPTNCLYDMALMRALVKTAKSIIEIVANSDRKFIREKCGEKNKFCRIKQNQRILLERYIDLSETIDDWFDKKGMDENVWNGFKRNWIEGKLSVRIEGMPAPKRVKSVGFNLPSAPSSNDAMSEMGKIELPGKFDLVLSKGRSAQFFSEMEDLRGYLWTVDQLHRGCVDALYKEEDAFALYRHLTSYPEFAIPFAKLKEGIGLALKYDLNEDKRKTAENCRYDFPFLRALIEILRSIIHVVVRSENAELKNEIICVKGKRYCTEKTWRDREGEARTKNGVDVVKENWQRMRRGIDDWFAEKQVANPNGRLMNIWKQYFEPKWIEGKFIVHIEGVEFPRVGQKPMSAETIEMADRLAELAKKKQNDLLVVVPSSAGPIPAAKNPPKNDANRPPANNNNSGGHTEVEHGKGENDDNGVEDGDANDLSEHHVITEIERIYGSQNGGEGEGHGNHGDGGGRGNNNNYDYYGDGQNHHFFGHYALNHDDGFGGHGNHMCSIGITVC